MKTIILLRLLASVVVGIVITLISGVIQTPMGHLGVDVVYWGISLPWTMRVIPTHFQSIDWVNFLADSGFWVVIVAIVSAASCSSKREDPSPIQPLQQASSNPHLVSPPRPLDDSVHTFPLDKSAIASAAHSLGVATSDLLLKALNQA